MYLDAYCLYKLNLIVYTTIHKIAQYFKFSQRDVHECVYFPQQTCNNYIIFYTK